MYILTVEDSFSSAHQLRGYKGKCENLHGHNWKVVASVKGGKLNEIGLLLDYSLMKKMLRSILVTLDHKNLNEIHPFTEINPSSENIAQFIHERFSVELNAHSPQIAVESIIIWESETSKCTYVQE